MMPFQPLFIPLYFDEAEEDLWLALQQIEPEKRSFFIKETLRQALLGTPGEKPFKAPVHKLSEEAVEISNEDCSPQEILAEEPEKEEEQSESFSLEELFVPKDPSPSHEKQDLLTNCSEVKSITGYEYMMKHIIGTEEDETVLKIIRGKEI